MARFQDTNAWRVIARETVQEWLDWRIAHEKKSDGKSCDKSYEVPHSASGKVRLRSQGLLWSSHSWLGKCCQSWPKQPFASTSSPEVTKNTKVWSHLRRYWRSLMTSDDMRGVFELFESVNLAAICCRNCRNFQRLVQQPCATLTSSSLPSCCHRPCTCIPELPQRSVSVSPVAYVHFHGLQICQAFRLSSAGSNCLPMQLVFEMLTRVSSWAKIAACCHHATGCHSVKRISLVIPTQSHFDRFKSKASGSEMFWGHNATTISWRPSAYGCSMPCLTPRTYS